MQRETEAGLISESEIVSTIERFGRTAPEELTFPASFKLNEKFSLHIDKRGLVLRDGRYVQMYSYMTTANQVVRLEKGA